MVFPGSRLVLFLAAKFKYSLPNLLRPGDGDLHVLDVLLEAAQVVLELALLLDHGRLVLLRRHQLVLGGRQVWVGIQWCRES